MSVPVTLTSYEMRHAATVGVIRHIASRAAGKSNLRGLSAKDVAEVWFVDLIGAMGELAFAKVAGLYWPGSVNVGKAEADAAKWSALGNETADRDYQQFANVPMDAPDCRKNRPDWLQMQASKALGRVA